VTESGLVAVVGIGCRFPGEVDTPARFWSLLHNGVDAIAEIPPDRIDLERYYSPVPATPGKITSRFGGYLRNIDRFDAGFFDISPREAERLDPQQRLLLEIAWEALEDAGQDLRALDGARAGVFVGLWLSDFEARLFANSDAVDFHMTTGTGRYAAAGRISFALGLRGPSLTLDTACSSSLAAVHLAVRSVRSGECELALAGGANVILQPHITIAYSQSLMMAPDGRCKFGDARGDGYVRSEGAGLVVLKRLDRALADGDRIYAVIRGSAVNNDGSSSGSMGTPSRIGQEELLRNAYADAGCSPADVGYVEAHGTGTRAGDPVELGALGAVLGPGRGPGSKVRVGSVKTNFGHTEGAAGIAGLIKVALALHHGEVPASLNCRELTSVVDWSSSPCEIAREAAPWTGAARVGGVSAFGISGTNAHAVLQGAPSAATSAAGPVTHDQGPFLLPLSARAPEALRAHAAAIADLIAASGAPAVRDVCATAALHRTAMTCRAAFAASTGPDLIDRLRRFADGEIEAAQACAATVEAKLLRIAFVFPGQGAQWTGMVRELIAFEPQFRAVLEQADIALRPFVTWSLMEQLAAEEGDKDYLLDRISVIQPVLLAVQLAFAALWRARGIEPAAVVGHSMGEVGAACLAGVIDLDAAMAIVVRRSALMEITSGQGAMAVVEISAAATEVRLAHYGNRVSVAVNNSPRSCVISGEPVAVDAVLAELERDGIFARRVKVDVASHSPQMDPLVADLVASQAALSPRQSKLPLYSTVEAAHVIGPELDAGHWGRNLRCTVRFGETVAAMIADGIDAFIELSPHPVLLTAIRQVADAANREVIALGSVRRDEPERLQMLMSLGELFVGGHNVAWKRLYGSRYTRVDLPFYPWQRERHWLETPSAARRDETGRDTLLGAGITASTHAETTLWNIAIGRGAFPYLDDHRVNGVTVFPAAGFIEMALEAAGQLSPKHEVRLADIAIDTALIVPEQGECIVQIAVEPGPVGNLLFTISSRRTDDRSGNPEWTAHARGLIATDPVEADCAGTAPALLDSVTSGGVAHYEDMSSYGLEYGPAFRGVRSIVKAGDTISAEVALPDAVSAGGYRIHPALLDACLQVAVAFHPPGDDARTPAPVAIERIVSTEPVGRASVLRVQATARRDDTASGAAAFTVDLAVVTVEGRPLLQIAGLRFALLDRAEHLASRGLYQVDWREAPLTVAKSSTTIWTILSDQRGVAAMLAPRLGLSQQDCIAFPGDDAVRGVLDQIMCGGDAAKGEGKTDGIVHMWSLDTSLDGLRNCLSVLELVKLAGREPVRRRRLVLVTAGAQAVLEGEQPAAAAAALWGLGRVIANEHPELGCTLIDLPATPSPHDIAALVRELAAAPDGEQIALRDGRRFVARLVRTDAPAPGAQKSEPAGQRSFRAHVDTPGILDDLTLRATPRTWPRAGEVEIAIASTGLNFMNVMSALGIYPGYPDGVGPLGIECAGRIVALGADVAGLAVGDAVMAMAFDSLASHVVVDARLVRRIPNGMSFAQAASMPVAFLTAHYGLNVLAQIERGERVLIHAATGGVGLAALQLARRAGAEVFATAGSEEKRAMLTSLGVAHVMDSRSLAFREQILDASGGLGVDVVLNSLSGAFIPASLAVLAPYGRFVELGKRDIYRNAHVGLAPFQRNLSFFAVDLDRMSRERPDRVGRMLDDIMDSFRAGALTPLPITEFPVSRVTDAFNLMARSAHTGKVVITGEDSQARIACDAGDLIAAKVAGVCVITGGLGGLGLAVAARLVQAGARSLVLIGRRPPDAAQRAALAALEANGATVRTFAADVGSAVQMQAVFDEIVSTMSPLSLVIHAAGVLDDGILTEQTAERFAWVMAPKVEGAAVLSALLADRPEVELVLFSSIASLLGLPGQGSYAAGNAVLDAVAARRRAQGGRAVAINWGPWSDIGLAAAQAVRGVQLGSRGIASLAPEKALDEFLQVLALSPAQIAVVNADWSVYRASTSGVSPLLDGMNTTATEDSPVVEQSARSLIVAADPGPARRAALESLLKQQIARVLRQSAGRIDAAKPFRSLGLDSLMGLELRNRLEAELSLSLPATVVWNFPTVRTLAQHLTTLLGEPAEPTVDDPPAAGGDEIDAILREIEKLPVDEAKRLLAAAELSERGS
jgi:acyl transferase domain-containing protein/acyl carrier protein